MSTTPTPTPTPMRETIEKASLPLIVRLNTLPRIVPFLGMLVLLVAGGLVGGVIGFLLMGMAALFLAWLLYLAWPGLATPERLMRIAVLVLASALAIIQLFPR